MAPTSGQPWFTQRTPTSAEAKPLTDPTDRSISPSIRMQTMPSEMTPMVEQSKSRLTRLLADRKTGLIDWKITEITTSPTTTGSEPRSPERTRSMKPRTQPDTPLRSFSRSSARSISGAPGFLTSLLMGLLLRPDRRPRCGWRGARRNCLPRR